MCYTAHGGFRLIQRPDNLKNAKVDFVFNGFSIREIEVDLEHINFGGSKKQERSNFNVQAVAKVCEYFFSEARLKSSGEKIFGDELCRYFKLSGIYRNKNYRIVICHCSDKPQTLGVITLFKET